MKGKKTTVEMEARLQKQVRDREAEGVSQLKHTVPVSHVQVSPAADASRGPGPFTTYHVSSNHFPTAKESNLPNLIITLRDLGDNCIMRERSHVQSPGQRLPVKIVNLIIINNGSAAAFQSCESKSLKWLQELQDYIVWRK